MSIRSDGAAIVYDADMLDQIDSRFFEPAFWRDRDAVIGAARGRGSVWIVRHGDLELVVRHYRRGGILGPWLGDRYLWLGLGRTRALREWHLLADLYARGLPVPRPVAGRVRRTGLCYRADIVTQRIDGGESLAQRLARAPLDAERWRMIGACLRRLHDAGVWHADLNAHNVLLSAREIYLVDFDRGRRRAPGSWRGANLARLRRSLDKLAAGSDGFCFDDAGWKELRAGYEAGAASAGQTSASAAR